MKILYYVTDHGLGHASRTVAIIREMKKKKVNVIIRSNDPFGFLKKSLPRIKIIKGQTDFEPVMCKDNGMLFDDSKTRKNLSNWIKKIPILIQKESSLIQKICPDVIVSDVSFMPLLAANHNKVNSVLVSSFIWNESLNIPKNLKQYVKDSYKKANLIIRLPLGTPVNFPNACSVGVVARHSTDSRKNIRRLLKIQPNQKFVLVSLSGKEKIQFKHSQDIKILDVSDYSAIKKSGMKNLTEGQNLIAAADLVICKCGYGFASECLTSKTRFFYVLEPKHKEAKSIHNYLRKLGLNNRIYMRTIQKTVIDNDFIKSADIIKTPFDNQNVVKKIMNLADRVI